MDLLLQQALGLEVPAADLDELLVVVFLLRVALVAGAGQRRQEQVVQPLELLELVAGSRAKHHYLRVFLVVGLRLLVEPRGEEDLLHSLLALLAVLLNQVRYWPY